MEDNKIIMEIEKLLSHTITSKSYILDGNGGLIETLKDKVSLYNELTSINKRLEDLYYEGEITLKEKNEMQRVVKEKYTKLIEKAPKKETTEKDKEETPIEQEKKDDFVPLYLFDDEPSTQTRKEDDFVPLHLFDDESFSDDRNKRKRR